MSWALISGFKENVHETKSAIQSDLHQFDKEITNVKFVQWFEMDRSDGWKEVDIHLNYILESNYEVSFKE